MNCARCQHKHLGSNLDLFFSLDSERASHPVCGGLKLNYLTARQNGWWFAGFSQYGTNISTAAPGTQLPKAFIASRKVSNADMEPVGMHSASLEKTHKFRIGGSQWGRFPKVASFISTQWVFRTDHMKHPLGLLVVGEKFRISNRPSSGWMHRLRM
jgi:hypothetical protein